MSYKNYTDDILEGLARQGDIAAKQEIKRRYNTDLFYGVKRSFAKPIIPKSSLPNSSLPSRLDTTSPRKFLTSGLGILLSLILIGGMRIAPKAISKLLSSAHQHQNR